MLRVANGVACALTAALCGGAALAAPGEGAEPEAGAPGYFNIAPTDFHPIDSAGAASFESDGAGFRSTNSAGLCAAVAVRLPEEAEIRSVTVNYVDGPTSSIDFALYRTQFPKVKFDVISSQYFSDNLGEPVTVKIPAIKAFAVVRSADFTYTARVCLQQGSSLISARINYRH